MLSFQTARPRVLAWALSLVALTVTGCESKNNVPTPPSAANMGLLMQPVSDDYITHGWIPLEAPDSRFVPGSVFMVKQGQPPQWLASLESCGVPKAVLEPTSSNSGQFTSTVEQKYGAGVVLKISGVTAGPDFKKARTATITQTESGPSAFDILKVIVWMTDPNNDNAFAPACRQFLEQENTYIARESYRIGSGTFTLKDETGAALNLSGLNVKIIEISANAGLKLTSDSKLQLAVPVFTAVREAVYANKVLKPLGEGGGTLRFADQKILEMYK